MSQQVFGESWKSTLEELGIDIKRTGTPAGAEGEWVEAMMRFGVHGFAMVFLKGEAGGLVRVRTHLALPAGVDSSAFGRELARRLQTLSADDAVVTEAGPPTILIASFTKVQDADAIRSLVTLLLKVGDYVGALESDPKAPSPLEQLPEEPEGDAEPTGGATFSGFEPIGSGEPAKDEPSEDAKEPAARPTGGAFESIGDAPREDAPEGDMSIAELRITGFDVHPTGEAVEVLVRLNGAPDTGARRALEGALSRALRVRADANVRFVGAASASAIAMTARPGTTQPARNAMRQLRDDVDRYLARLVDFDAAGMRLAGVLDMRASSARVERAPAPRAERAPRTERSEPAPREEAGGFVLGLGSGAPSRNDEPEVPEGEVYVERGDALKPGDFADPRLRRPDAEGALVDVVLRHPGYSDRRIGQVLSILLSVDYPTARRIADDAPCVILWGVDRDRAVNHFKSLIDGAGGKVLLVEPNTFAPG